MPSIKTKKPIILESRRELLDYSNLGQEELAAKLRMVRDEIEDLELVKESILYAMACYIIKRES